MEKPATVQYYGTGRRKDSVARVYLRPGDGKIVVNKHTSSELAVIGSGDVLVGIITSLVGDKKMSLNEAAAAATWIHGDIAKRHGRGLISEDLVKGIPSALQRLKK